MHCTLTCIMFHTKTQQKKKLNNLNINNKCDHISGYTVSLLTLPDTVFADCGMNITLHDALVITVLVCTLNSCCLVLSGL